MLPWPENDSVAVLVVHTSGHRHFAWARTKKEAEAVVRKRQQPAMGVKFGPVDWAGAFHDLPIHNAKDWDQVTPKNRAEWLVWEWKP